MGICPWKNWHRKALKIQCHPLSHQNGTKQANPLQLSALCWTPYFFRARSSALSNPHVFEIRSKSEG